MATRRRTIVLATAAVLLGCFALLVGAIAALTQSGFDVLIAAQDVPLIAEMPGVVRQEGGGSERDDG